MRPRKDSIGFVEFIRGRYASNDLDYLHKMFYEMTIAEKNSIKKLDFTILWENLWMENKFKLHKKSPTYGYNKACDKFYKIKNGYYIQNQIINIDILIKNSKSNWTEPEWGFPKGRRNTKENDFDAAKREFMEESGLKKNKFIILSKHITFIEEYVGSDNIKYRHKYYLAKHLGKKNLKINKNNRHQITEISNIGFFTLKKSLELIRQYNMEKRQLLTKIENYINKNGINNLCANFFQEQSTQNKYSNSI